MSNGAESYAIYSLKTGRLAARIRADGSVQSEGDSEAVKVLTALLQKDLVVREHQIDADPQSSDEDYDPYPEESMCYFNVVTLRPGDPRYLQAFLRRLPYISFYEARPD